MPNDQLPEPVNTAQPPPSRTPILLVDDDVEVRRALQLLLHAADYDVRAYATAESLLADPRLDAVACLIADTNTPDMDGFALLRRLRAGGWMGPAILITSSREAELAARASSAGFQTVLIKPLADRVVLEAVRRTVQSDPVQSPAATQ